MNYIQGDYVMPWFTKIAAGLLATVLGIGTLSTCSANPSLPSNTTSDNNASQQKVDTSEDSTKEKSQNSQEESTEKPADLTDTWKNRCQRRLGFNSQDYKRHYYYYVGTASSIRRI